MIKNCILLLSVFLFISCTSNDSTQPCKLLSCQTKTLYYDEITIGPMSYNPSFSGKIIFEYDNIGRISKLVNGPIKPYPENPAYIFFDGIENNVTYIGDTITIENKIDYIEDYNSFIINDEKLSYRKVKKQIPYNIAFEYNYEYVGNTVIEKRNGAVTRTFFIENNNLVRVEAIRRNGDVILGKEEMTFLQYDSSENLLKGKFFIHGAFYKAFSVNNFKRIEIQWYDYTDGAYVLNELHNSYSQFSFSVGENNIPDLFETDCDNL